MALVCRIFTFLPSFYYRRIVVGSQSLEGCDDGPQKSDLYREFLKYGVASELSCDICFFEESYLTYIISLNLKAKLVQTVHNVPFPYLYFKINNVLLSNEKQIDA